MNGLFGWAGPRGAMGDARNTLQAMDPGLDHFAGLSTAVHTKGAVACHGDRTNVYCDDDVIVAITGYPRIATSFPAHPVAQAVASAYRVSQERLFRELHGPFSLVIIDLRDGAIVLAIDRMGIEPLTYAVNDETVIFANRADVVASHPLASRDIDPQAIFDYLYFHCVPSPRSIYAGQNKLLPGQVVRIHGDHVQSSFYWTLQYGDAPASFANLYDPFLDLLHMAVKDVALDPHLGSFLSGGTDSSTVAGVLAEVNRCPPNTYSIGFSADGYDEMEYARIASNHFHTRPHEYYVTSQDVVTAIPLIAAHYDEPFGNASAIPTYYCAKLAAEDGIATMLAGDGGDEIFGGNVRYARQMVFEMYKRIPRLLRENLFNLALLRDRGTDRPGVLSKIRSYVAQARIPLPDRLEAYNFLHRDPLETIFTPAFLKNIDSEEPVNNMREVYQRTTSRSPIQCMMHMDLKLTLADNDLRKVNRACELAGVAVRYPMLDERLVEFSARIPPGMQVRRFQLRYFFKRALRDFLPSEILAKSKHGFGLPFGLWMRDDPALRSLSRDALEAFKRRGYIRSEYIDSLFAQHSTGHAAYFGVMIWVLVMLEYWLQTHGYAPN
jgi:asparagine synthase (glutamine-hydrolysing)